MAHQGMPWSPFPAYGQYMGHSVHQYMGPVGNAAEGLHKERPEAQAQSQAAPKLKKKNARQPSRKHIPANPPPQLQPGHDGTFIESQDGKQGDDEEADFEDDGGQQRFKLSEAEEMLLIHTRCRYEDAIVSSKNNPVHRVWEEIMEILRCNLKWKTDCTLKQARNRFEYLLRDYQTWCRKRDSLGSKITGSDGREIDELEACPPLYKDLFDSYEMFCTPLVRPLFHLNAERSDDLLAQEPGYILDEEEEGQRSDSERAGYPAQEEDEGEESDGERGEEEEEEDFHGDKTGADDGANDNEAPSAIAEMQAPPPPDSSSQLATASAASADALAAQHVHHAGSVSHNYGQVTYMIGANSRNDLHQDPSAPPPEGARAVAALPVSPAPTDRRESGAAASRTQAQGARGQKRSAHQMAGDGGSRLRVPAPPPRKPRRQTFNHWEESSAAASIGAVPPTPVRKKPGPMSKTQQFEMLMDSFAATRERIDVVTGAITSPPPAPARGRAPASADKNGEGAGAENPAGPMGMQEGPQGVTEELFDKLFVRMEDCEAQRQLADPRALMETETMKAVQLLAAHIVGKPAQEDAE